MDELEIEIPEELSVEVEPTETPEPEEPREEPKKLSAVEQEASEEGWTDLETWKAQGKDPDRWKPAQAFIDYGNLQKANAKQAREFEERLQNLQKLHDIRLQQELQALEAQRLKAIEYADVESFRTVEEQIKSLQQAALPKQEVSKPPEVQLWEAKNPWIFEKSEKATEAKALADAFIKSKQDRGETATWADTLKYVDERISKLYPITNPRREMPTQTETGQRPTKQSNKLSWSDLSDSELREYKQFGNLFKSKEHFLKAVADDRRSKK